MPYNAENLTFSDIIDFKPLTGFSGASIFLASKNGTDYFVRKVAKDFHSSDRLVLQADKQKEFKNLNINSIKVPKVFNDGYIDNIYYFDMDYIEGKNAVEYIQSATYNEILLFTDKLFEFFNAAKSVKLKTKINIYEILHNKATSVFSKVNCLSTDDMIAILDNLYSIKDFDDLDTCICHGDLTLENMIVSPDGNIYFLDFLDAPFDHIIQDFSKMYQDIEGKWFERNNISIEQDKLDMLSGDLKDIINILSPNYNQLHNVLLMMNFLRILPYTKTEEETIFVKNKLLQFVI